jgi:hypothetical protein
VPVLPAVPSLARSQDVIKTSDDDDLDRARKSMEASIFGRIEPAGNWPSVRSDLASVNVMRSIGLAVGLP